MTNRKSKIITHTRKNKSQKNPTAGGEEKTPFGGKIHWDLFFPGPAEWPRGSWGVRS